MSREQQSALGMILVKMGCLSTEQVDHALAAQKALPGVPLGEVLAQYQMVTNGELEAALAYQKRMREGGRVGVMMDLVAYKVKKVHAATLATQAA